MNLTNIKEGCPVRQPDTNPNPPISMAFCVDLIDRDRMDGAREIIEAEHFDRLPFQDPWKVWRNSLFSIVIGETVRRSVPKFEAVPKIATLIKRSMGVDPYAKPLNFE